MSGKLAGNRERLTMVGCLVAATLPLGGIAVSRLLYPYDVGVYEAQTWAPGELMMAGQNPYDSSLPIEPPYVVSVYGPVYYLIIGLGLSSFGHQLWFGRLVADLSAVITVLCVGRLSHLMTGSSRLALFSSLVFVSQFPIQAWIGVQRPDLTALGMSLLGMTMALGYLEGRKGDTAAGLARMAVASILFVIAILCRQTSILPALFIAAWCIRRRKWKGITALLVCFGGVLASAILFLNVSSKGGFVQQVFLTPSSIERHFSRTLSHISALAIAPSTWLLAVLVGGALIKIAPLGRLSNNTPPARPLCSTNRLSIVWKASNGAWVATFAGASLLLAIVTSSISGSNVNYYLECSAALAVLAPFSLRVWETGYRASIRWSSVFMILTAVAALSTGVRVCRGEYFRWRSVRYFDEVVIELRKRVQIDQPCFSVYPELATSAGRIYYFNSDVPYDGRSDTLAMVFRDVLASRKLAAIVSHSPEPPLGYSRVPLSEPVPKRFYPVFLHARSDLPVER